MFEKKKRPSRKKRVLVGTAIATAVLTIAGAIAHNQDQSS